MNTLSGPNLNCDPNLALNGVAVRPAPFRSHQSVQARTLTSKLYICTVQAYGKVFIDDL